jgi:hypothetical protein
MLVLSYFLPQAMASNKMSRGREYANLIKLRQQGALIGESSGKFDMRGLLLHGIGNVRAAQYLSFLFALQFVSLFGVDVLRSAKSR